MALSLAQLRTAINDRGLGTRTDITDAEITRYINLAQERITRAHPRGWPELRQTTDITLSASGTAAADKVVNLSSTLGTTFRALYNLVIEDSAESQKIEIIPPDQFDATIPLPEYYSRGKPYIATLWTDSELLLHWVPDEAYTMRTRWFKWPTALADDADTSDLLRKDDLIIHLTLSFVLSLVRVEDSLKHFGIYQTLLKEAIGEATDTPEVAVIRPNFLLGTRGSAGPIDNYWANPWYKG